MQYLWKAKTQVRCFVCLVVMSAVAGVPARGDVVIFDNRDGEFGWHSTCDPKICTPDTGTYLDVTQPPSQSGDSNEITFSLFFEVAFGTPHWDTFTIRRASGSPLGVIQTAADDAATVLLDETGTPTDFDFARELGPGGVVDSGLNFVNYAFLFASNAYTLPPTMEEIETPRYIGVSIISDSQLHYGWILLDTFGNDYYPDFEPLLWAYETDPETPITIPDLSCTWDLDGDTIVGIDEFLTVLEKWGTDPGGPPDFDGDGDVGILDFLALLANWGPCPLN